MRAHEMNALLDTPHHEALWDKVLEGFKYISGRDWEERANYQHFWTLVDHLYKLTHGTNAHLPDVFIGPLMLMFCGHTGRIRKGIRGRPYFHHPLMVLYLAWLLKLPLSHQLAAISHDDIEDVPKQLNVVESWIRQQLAFQQPPEVVAIVDNLTNKPEKGEEKHTYQKRKIATMPLLDAVLKLCDRICNMYDMRHDKPKTFTPSRIEKECYMALELTEAMPVQAPEPVLALMAFAIDLLVKENELTLA